MGAVTQEMAIEYLYNLHKVSNFYFTYSSKQIEKSKKTQILTLNGYFGRFYH